MSGIRCLVIIPESSGGKYRQPVEEIKVSYVMKERI
jgi:hypothetical protein